MSSAWVASTLMPSWYRALASVKSVKWWLTTSLVLGFWILIGWPVYQTNILRGVLHTALALGLVYGRARRNAAPINLQLVEHAYVERKIEMHALLQKIQYQRQTMTPEEIRGFQRSVLRLIASYVRGHRADHRGVEIFVNLMMVDGDDLVVVARADEHRVPGARYPKAGMTAWAAMQSGEAAFCGDIQREKPALARPRPYRSILAIPVHGDNRILGVVSVDSSRIYHFHGETDTLTRYLLPYVCLLGWTLLDPALMIVGEVASLEAAPKVRRHG